MTARFTPIPTDEPDTRQAPNFVGLLRSECPNLRDIQRVTPDSWCDDWTKECAAGIHFYISRIEAEAHQ